jgi:NodT family efflux transporter outer membrane factor (OMF) lipoprotein
VISRRLCLALLAPLVWSGCRTGVPYQRPSLEAPAGYKEFAETGDWKVAAPSDDLPKGKWWEVFGDPQLNQLEELLGVDNLNIKQAEAQFREARAAVSLNRANAYPVVGVGPAITASGAGGNTGRLSGSTQTFSVPVDASWEPDLWGRVRLSVENAVSNAQVSAADLENVRLSAQALLATDYFSLVASDMQQAVLSDTIAAYERNLRLTTDRFNAGVVSRADITLAQTQLSGARAQSTDLRIARAELEHAIATLTGRVPSELQIGPGMIGGPPPEIPVAVPSQLLERRPDIAATERLVAAANANVGLAQAAYYPTLTLSASVGVLATNVANLVTFAARSWSGSGTLSQTALDFGRRRAQLAGATAAYDATVASYRQTVLSAFEEVENDLASLRYLAEEAQHQQQAVTAAQQSLNLELDRYRAGTDSYLNVITTQAIALNDQQAAVSILQRRMNAAVALIKALGGGWDVSSLPSSDELRHSAALPRSCSNPPCPTASDSAPQ